MSDPLTVTDLGALAVIPVHPDPSDNTDLAWLARALSRRRPGAFLLWRIV